MNHIRFEEGNKKRNNTNFKPAHVDKEWYLDTDTSQVCADENEYINEIQAPKWYEEISDRIEADSSLSEEEITILKREASTILNDETLRHAAKKKGGKMGGDRDWIKTVLQKGTASDKVAAYVVTIQDAPVFSLSSLTALVNMVKVGKDEFLLVKDSLPELFITDLLPPSSKLLPFRKQPLDRLFELSSGNSVTRRRYLMLWAFEDELKSLYIQFLQALNTIAQNGIEAIRAKAISVMYHLLNDRPEQEEVLLKNLVNKLGDPSQKVASKTIYCLTQLLRVHPAMKQVVLNEVENLLFRLNVERKTQYYAICFLSQFVYSANDAELASNVISVYFSVFRACVKKAEVNSKILGSLLMGLNRAYPYAKKNSDKIAEHVKVLYRMVHMANYNNSIHCLRILFRIDSSEDRFYTSLYKKLSDLELTKSSHHAIFINLIYQALLKDTDMGRIRTFIKRLLQLCITTSVPLACALLYTISQILKNRPKLHSVELRAHLSALDDDNEEEYYKDAPLKDLDESKEKVEEEDEKKERKPCASWHHSAIYNRKDTFEFDPFQRNPLAAKGELAVYTELSMLTKHFHPTVALFAKNILENQIINYIGDPLIDFAPSRFLDRFVFKNPKEIWRVRTKGPDPVLAKRLYYRPYGAKVLPLDSKLYMEQEEKDVPVDELFLFRYQQQRKELGYNVIKKSNKNDDSDLESVASEEFEEMLNSMPDFKDREIDFAEEIGDKLNNRQAKKKKGAKSQKKDDYFGNSNEDKDDSFDDDDDDFNLDDDDDDDDEEVMEFDDDEDEDVYSSKKKRFKFDNLKGVSNVFAPAEQFAEMLEEAGSSGRNVGTIHAVSNRDKADVKQLDWEMKRCNDSWKDKAKRKKTKKSIKGKKKRKH